MCSAFHMYPFRIRLHLSDEMDCLHNARIQYQENSFLQQTWHNLDVKRGKLKLPNKPVSRLKDKHQARLHHMPLDYTEEGMREQREINLFPQLSRLLVMISRLLFSLLLLISSPHFSTFLSSQVGNESLNFILHGCLSAVIVPSVFHSR